MLTAAVRARLLSPVGFLLEARLQEAQSAETPRNRNRPTKGQAVHVRRLMNSTRNGDSEKATARWLKGRGWALTKPRLEPRQGLCHPCTCTTQYQATASDSTDADWKQNLTIAQTNHPNHHPNQLLEPFTSALT